MASFRSNTYSFVSLILDFASIIFVVLIGCTAATLNQLPLNAAVEVQGETSFVCSSDTSVPHWVYSSNGKSDRDAPVKSDACSVDPENDFHFQTQRSNNKCTLTVRNATKELAGVYTCIDGTSKSDRFSALLTVLDPYPTIRVENESRVFEGQTLNIVCNTSYAGPAAPAPPMAPSVYFSTSDGQRVSDVNVFVAPDQVLAFFAVAAKSPLLPSFTCNVFFPTVNETKQRYASNTPNNTYNWSSPVIQVSRESDFKTDAPSLTTTACKTVGCDENKQNTSTDDETDEWQSNPTNQSNDNATDGENNYSEATSAVEVTTALYPSGRSGNESTNATDDNTNTDDHDRKSNYTNETNYYDTDFPAWYNKSSGKEASENSTDIESERKTSIINETTTYNQTALPNSNDTVSNATATVANVSIETNYTYETHYGISFPNGNKTTSGMESSDNDTDIGGNKTTNSTSETNTYYYKIDSSRNISDSAYIVADGGRTTNYTYEITVGNETASPTLNTTVPGTESSANSTGIDIGGIRTTINVTTTDYPIAAQEWNATVGPVTESTNFTDGGDDENYNTTDRIPTYLEDGVSRDNTSATRSDSNIMDFPFDSFLNSIFAFNETFFRLYRNEAPHILKASFTSVVIAESIFLFFMY